MNVSESLSTVITQLWIIVLILAVILGIVVGSLFVILYSLMANTRRRDPMLRNIDKKNRSMEAGIQEKGEREEYIRCSREKEGDERYSAKQYDRGWMPYDAAETADDGGQYGRNSKKVDFEIADFEVVDLEKRDLERREPERRNPERRDFARTELERRDFARTELEKREPERRDFARTELERRDLERRDFARTEPERRELKRSQGIDVNIVHGERKNIKIQLCNPDGAIRYNSYSGLQESPEGKVVIFEQKGSEFYARPVEDSLIEKDYYRTVISRCFDVNPSIEAGYTYNVTVEESCVLEKEGDGYRVVKKGKLYIEKDSGA